MEPPVDHRIDYARLPRVARRLITAIGLDRTITLLRRCGGHAIYIPGRSASVLISETLGLDFTAPLRDELGSGWVDLPRVDCIMRQIRDHSIREASMAGHSISRLAKHYRLSRRRIASIVRR